MQTFIRSRVHVGLILSAACTTLLLGGCSDGVQTDTSQSQSIDQSNGIDQIDEVDEVDGLDEEEEAGNTARPDTVDEIDAGSSETQTPDGATENAQDTTTAPNILLIISDDQGLESSAQYSLGSDLPTTPVLDNLASSGLVMENAWATPSCTTTRGSIISGQHGINSGVTTTPSLMDPNTLTLQRYLATSQTASSYSTAVVGKWHLAGGNTENQLTHPTDSGVGYYAGNISGTLDDYYEWPLTTNGATTTSTTYHTTAVTDLAIDWIQEQSSPWFMWLAYVAPHSPFHLPPDNLHTRDLSGEAADIQNNPREYYLAAIEAMDTEIGRLLDSLPEATADNTLIVFIGDNGTPRAVIDTSVYTRAHGKNSLYEGGIHVPMIVSGNGVTRINERESALVNTVDIFPTVVDAAGLSAPDGLDGFSFYSLLSDSDASARDVNYSEFVSADTTGWTVRDGNLKLIVLDSGERELYDLNSGADETANIIDQTDQYSTQIASLEAFGNTIRGEQAGTAVDITGATLVEDSPNCMDYVNTYQATATDVAANSVYDGQLAISSDGETCSFSSNATPNHDFNDADTAFPNAFSQQSVLFNVPVSPTLAAQSTALSLTLDNAVLLNGVKVDILAAGCFGVGNGRIGCNDPDQPWRYDPLAPGSGFLVDSHNAHTQPDGTYHYHGEPNALFSSEGDTVSPVIGFAADGFPLYGSYIDDGEGVREVQSSYRLISGARPTGTDQPGGTYDGTYRDDYEYVEGLGDLDECNGREVDGQYRYHTTNTFPYVLGCFKGTPDTSFNK